MKYVFWNWENKRNVIWFAIKYQGSGEAGLSYVTENNRIKCDVEDALLEYIGAQI